MAKVKRYEYRSGAIQIPQSKKEAPSWIGALILLCIPGLWPIGGILVVRNLCLHYKQKKLSNYRACAAIIGERAEVDVRELSAKLGRPESAIMTDLQTMIDKGYMGQDAYLDHSRGFLIMRSAQVEGPARVDVHLGPLHVHVDTGSDEAARTAVKSPAPEAAPAGRRVSLQKQPEARKADVAASADAPAKPARGVSLRKAASAGPDNETFEANLRRLHELDERIADEGVSQSIRRIGTLTTDIFRVTRQKPEQAQEVKKFVDYYLPVTIKLLEDYALMAEQSYQGGNIREARRKIEEILTTLVASFEQQLDRLFSADTLNVETDITMVESMLARDGLSGTGDDDIHKFVFGQAGG